MKAIAQIVRESYEGWLMREFDNFFLDAISDWDGAIARLKNGLAMAVKCRTELESIACGETLALTLSQGSQK